MRELCFYGASDDLFEIEGTTVIAKVFCKESGEGLHVVGCYAPGKKCHAACWSIGLMQLDEDAPLPDWNFRYSYEGYSVHLFMDAPDDAVVSMVDT